MCRIGGRVCRGTIVIWSLENYRSLVARDFVLLESNFYSIVTLLAPYSIALSRRVYITSPLSLVISSSIIGIYYLSRGSVGGLGIPLEKSIPISFCVRLNSSYSSRKISVDSFWRSRAIPSLRYPNIRI